MTSRNGTRRMSGIGNLTSTRPIGPDSMQYMVTDKADPAWLFNRLGFLGFLGCWGLYLPYLAAEV